MFGIDTIELSWVSSLLFVLENQEINLTHLIAVSTLLWWPGAKSVISPRYACILPKNISLFNLTNSIDYTQLLSPTYR